MFNFFKSKKPHKPLDQESRKYFEYNFMWLAEEFGDPDIHNRKILLPNEADFPIKWNNTRENALEVLKIICVNMQIDFSDIELDFYKNEINEISTGSSLIFLQSDPDSPEAAGLYHGKNQDNKYQISIEEHLLLSPDALIATLAHEVSHVKLLGEKKLDENDEMLTDLATVYFGLGIFNANTAFQFYQETHSWGYRNMGYLKIEEWAYALALLAFIRKEEKPEWAKYLSSTIKNDFERCLQFMTENKGDIFFFEENN